MKTKNLLVGVGVVLVSACSTSPGVDSPSGDRRPSSGDASIFDIGGAIPIFTLTTDYKTLWAHRAPANQALPPDIAGFKGVAGTLTWTDTVGAKAPHAMKVIVELRGNTSQSPTECPFPKMTITFDKGDEDSFGYVDPRKNTLFAHMKKIGIGTQCSAKEGTSGGFSRIWGGAEPAREALIYKVQSMLELPAFRTASTQFLYVDSMTGAYPIEESTNYQAPAGVAINSYFLEDMSGFEQRTNSKEILPVDYRFKKPDRFYIFNSVETAVADAAAAPPAAKLNQTIKPMDMDEVLKALLFQALIDNSDWALHVSNQYPIANGLMSLWNMKVVQTPGGTWTVIPYDYDLAGWSRARMGGGARYNFPKGLFPPDSYSRVAKIFNDRKPAMLGALNKLTASDPIGAANIKANIDSFYTFLASVVANAGN
jgi:hypothetical protein